jgi:hypothetical protein
MCKSILLLCTGISMFTLTRGREADPKGWSTVLVAPHWAAGRKWSPEAIEVVIIIIIILSLFLLLNKIAVLFKDGETCMFTGSHKLR